MNVGAAAGQSSLPDGRIDSAGHDVELADLLRLVGV